MIALFAQVAAALTSTAPATAQARVSIQIKRAMTADEQTWREQIPGRRRELLRVERDGRLSRIRVIEHE